MRAAGDARFGEKCRHHIEDRWIVVIEADDHAAPDIDAVLLDAMHALEQCARVRPHVLMLLGLSSESSFGVSMPMKTFWKLARPISSISSSSSARSSEASVKRVKRIGTLLLPADDVAQHGLDRLLVADQIVIDDEDDFNPARRKRQARPGPARWS